MSLAERRRKTKRRKHDSIDLVGLQDQEPAARKGASHALRQTRQHDPALLSLIPCFARRDRLGHSPWFALQFGSYVLVNMLGWLALRAPTAAGRALLQQLSDFRMFLAEVDSDRINRMNAPNAAAASAEKYWGSALALDIEHTWGEQFAAAVLNQLGPDSALLSIEGNLPEDRRTSQDLLDLHLR